MIVTDAVILIVASHFGWPVSYMTMAVLMVVGCVASLVAIEPARAKAVFEGKNASPLWSTRGLVDAIAGPFIEFFRCTGGPRS